VFIYLNDHQIVTSRYNQLFYWFLGVQVAISVGLDQYAAVYTLWHIF
jgi:hypothetical protein